MTTCATTNCQHAANCHRYMVTTGRNGGECLAPSCPCGQFKESEK